VRQVDWPQGGHPALVAGGCAGAATASS
jgi:hypothetical protein